MIFIQFKFVAFYLLMMTEFVTSEENVVYNPYFHFPGGSDAFMGMILTIAIPVELNTPGDIIFSTIFEANYLMPTNETEFDYPPIITDVSSSERTFLYQILERRIDEFGYTGKKCLLRMICEAAEYSTQYTGVLGDIVHIMLTPSSSKKK